MKTLDFKEKYPFYKGIVNSLLERCCNGMEKAIQLRIDILHHNGSSEHLSSNSSSEQKISECSISFETTTIRKINISLYVCDKKIFKERVANCYYDEKNQEYSMLALLFDNILSEIKRIIWKDILKGENYTTANYDKDDEILIFQTVNDFLWSNKLPDLMNIMNLSSLLYEGRQCKGSLIFIKQIAILEKHILFFSKPIIFNMNNQRLIRKLLEITVEKYSLVYDLENNNIVGMLCEIDELGSCDVFKLTFLGQLHWKLLYKQKNIVEYDMGHYYLIDQKDWYVNFERDWENVSEKCLQVSKEQCLKLVEAVRQQTHGAIIILSDIAKTESTRLCSQNRGVSIESFNFLQDTNLIQRVTSIDGAVMIDYDYMCYGIGIILDGPAVKGDTSRGSRYNSALTYVKWEQSGNAIAIVISEDGMVDLLSK